jgi:hypothetical protein
MTAPRRPGGSVAQALPGILARMITRRGRPRFRVRLEVPRTGGMRARGAAAGAFEQRFAAQAGPVVTEARLHSETRRGRDMVRISILITVTASDIGQAAVIAWDIFKVAAGEEAAAWDMPRASAEIRPEDKARLTAPRHRVALSTAWFPWFPWLPGGMAG